MPTPRTAIILAHARPDAPGMYDFDAFAGGEQLNLMGFSQDLVGALIIPMYEIAKREAKRCGDGPALLDRWADEMEKWAKELRTEAQRGRDKG